MVGELIKDVESAFNATYNIPVSGDAVDALALVRLKLRRVHDELKNMNQHTACDTEGA